MFKKFISQFYNFIFSTADNRVKIYITLLLFFKNKNKNKLALIVSRRLQCKYGVFLSCSADFDKSLILRHPVGIVIGQGVVIGKNVIIYQNVTLGTAKKGYKLYPKIGNNTIIYSGAVIIGNIEIGESCVIGANSVVTKNVPNNAVVVGNPARVLSVS